MITRVAGWMMAASLAAGCSSTGDSCDGLYMNPQEGGPVTLTVGGMLQLSTIRMVRDFSSEGTGACATAFDDASHFIWTSSNIQVATVDATGLVRAVAAGRATVSANGIAAPYQFAKPATQEFIVR